MHTTDTHELSISRLIRTRYGEVLDSTPDGIIIVEPTGAIVFASLQAEVLFGYGRDELTGLPMETLMPQHFRPSHVQHRSNFFSQPRTRPMGMGLELFGLRKDGSQFPVEISLSPLKTDEGMLVMSAIRDITQKKHAEQLMQERSRELEAANNELGAFSYSVSHDLRAPLRAINGFCRIIMEEYTQGLPPELVRFLQLIATNSSHMGVLVDDLLKFSQLSRQQFQPRSIAMTALARATLEETMTAEDRKNFVTEVKEMADCSGDIVLMKQVWTNLISNALKFTRGSAAPSIEIGERRMDGAPTYYVKDNGAGFDMQYAHKLFGVFQRLHRSEEFEGTGVGLALVQRIVLRHGGTIRAESELGKGSTFYFTVGVSNGV
jgi:PAS domain S-box-containing protein